MITSEKCIIDNWSLEHSALLFESDSFEVFPSDLKFIEALGGLSNYINAILLYDQTNFISNGYEYAWERFNWFRQNTILYVKPLDNNLLRPLGAGHYNKWDNYYDSIADRLWFDEIKFYQQEEESLQNKKRPITRFQGNPLVQSKYRSRENPYKVNAATMFYLMVSGHFRSDLFISPGRSRQIIEQGKRVNNSFSNLLSQIDEIAKQNIDMLWFDTMRAGVTDNFFLPPLTHYVLSQSTNLEDLFKTIMQIKSSGIILEYRQKIKHLSYSTKDFGKFQIEMESIIKECFGKLEKRDKPWAIKMNILFFTFTKSFNVSYGLKKTYMTFLKDLMDCRTEMFGLRKDIKRLFKREIDFNSQSSMPIFWG